MRGAKQIAIGCVALATVPVVGWLAFSYHVAIGVAVSIIYGSAAVLIGTSSIARGALAIGQQIRARRDAEQLRALPHARLLDREHDSEHS